MHITSLYRSPAPTRLASAWALTAALIVFFSTWASHGVHGGIRGGAAVFFAWAIVRELAPNRPLPSLYAPFLAVAFAIPEHTDILACLAVVLIARIASRTVGARLTWFDYALLVPVAGWVATRPVGLPVALVLAAVIFVEEAGWRARAFGVLTLAVVIITGSFEGTLTIKGGWDDPTGGRLVLIVVLALAAIRLVLTRLPVLVRVRDDRRLDWLRGANIRVARIAVVAALGATVVWVGTDGLFHLSAASAAVVAVGLGGVKLRARRNPALSGSTSSGSSEAVPSGTLGT
jgi:hypothetical protein